MWSPSWSALLGSLWAVVGGPFGGCFKPKAPVLAMVDATRDAFNNIGTSLKDVFGTVVVLLVAVAKVISTRDALEIMGPSRRCRR